MHVEYVLIVAAQTKLASEKNTQVDLTVDGEYLYTAALHLTVCTL